MKRAFAAAFALYLVVGVWLALGEGYLLGDALSRVSAAQAVLRSRDPHVAAIGFVFTPLTALVQLPAVAFSGLFPGITRWGLSGVLMSALFMAGAVAQVRGLAADRGLPRWQVRAVAAVFALHPLVVFYGANGMSEAPFLFFLCWALRRLVRWSATDDAHDLLAAGIALGLAYLVRYDALAVGGAATLFVGAVAFARARRAGGAGVRAAAMDMVLVAAPSALAFGAWAASGWLLTGHAFAQFSSQYGNAAILAQSGAAAPGLGPGLVFAATEVLVLAPALLLLAPLSLWAGWRRREVAAALPAVLCGAVLAFQGVTYASGGTFGFLRFYIAAVVWLAAAVVLLAPARALPPSRRPGAHAAAAVPAGSFGGRVAPLAVAGAAAGSLAAGWGMVQPDLAPQEHALAGLVAAHEGPASDVEVRRLRILATFSTERRIADYLDSLDLPPGSVLADTVYGFAVTTASARPETFVVPSDQDFVKILNDPARFGVRYILAVPPSGRGVSDAVNRRYPTMYANGAQIATLDLHVDNDGADQPPWRIYRVLDPVTPR